MLETKDSNNNDSGVPQKEYITKEEFESKIKLLESQIRVLETKIQNLTMLF